jgi:Ca2+-binding RTX toxin-like protein
MSSIVLDFNDGSSLVGENLEYIGKQVESNLIDVKPFGNEAPSPVSIVGGSKDDTIRLTAAGDSAAMGLDGNDMIIGGAGYDLIGGGEGNDELRGSLGKDNLTGGVGTDTLDGGQDNDVLNAGHGNDALRGGVGHDILDAGLGDDTLDGGDGNDSIAGGDGNDSIVGGAGHDTLRGGPGADMMTGGDGNDLFAFVAQELASDTMDHITDFQGEGTGTDRISIVGVGDMEMTYDAETGMVSIDGLEALDIGKDLKGIEMKNIEGTDNWEIM